MSTRPGPLARALLASIHGYQAFSRTRPPHCRYVPSCSEYAADAVRLHGAGRGTWLAVRRLARCAPWGGHGYDPVPSPSVSRQIWGELEPRAQVETPGR